LIGFAFAATYAVVGVPVARYADLGHRRRVIASSVAVWSLMTASCGFAQNFLQLAVGRFGVGVGEAGALPASQSIITELFPAEKRNTALALLACGGALGLTIAFSLGSVLDHWLGWRWTFVVIALPGILLCVIVKRWIDELPLARQKTAIDGEVEAERWQHDLPELCRNKIFRHLPFAQAANVVLLFNQAQWIPAYIERTFGASRSQIGPMLGLMQGGAGLIGTIFGGLIADRLLKRGAAWPIRVAMGAALASVVPMFGVYFVPTASQVYPLAGLMTLFLSMPTGAIFSTLQNAVPAGTRSTAAAVSAMVAAFVGLGAGPLVVGFLSDRFSAAEGPNSLRSALIVTDAVATPWLIFHLWRVLRILG